MRDIKVSVCVITYNQEMYIRQCLDSLLNQKTNFDYEVIVAEDCSPDNTRQILLEYKEKYGDKLVLVLHDENVGVSKNSFSARILAKGKYLASCEGDDYWTDEYKLQKQYDILENNPQYSAVASDYMLITFDGKVISKNVLCLKKDIVKKMDNWLKEGFTLHTCTNFTRREIFPYENERFQKLRTSAPTMGDIITYTLLYEAGDIYVMKDVMAAHREAGEKDIFSFSRTNKTKAIKYSYMCYDIVKALEEYLDYKYDFMPIFVNRLTRISISKLKGQVSFDNKEFKKLYNKLDFRKKLMFHYRLVNRFIKMAFRKIKRELRKRI